MIHHFHQQFGYSIQILCRLFHVSRSSYYTFQTKTPSRRVQENNQIKQEIMKSYLASNKTYGAPRIRQDLLALGYVVSEKRVQKLMKELEIQSIIRKKYRAKTSTKTNQTEYINLLKQDFTTNNINTKWATDITYIYTLADGWCYLSSILDLHSRKIIAWKLSTRMETSLVIETLKDALATRNIEGTLILHSDQGSQYTSMEYNDYLNQHGIRHSYSAKGCPYDNSCIESFHATLKKECIYAKTTVGYPDFESCYQCIFEYIEGFYNTRRRHSSLCYLSPNEYEKQVA